MIDEPTESEFLSAGGQRRRREILRTAIAAMSARRARRIRMQVVAVGCVCAVLTFGLWPRKAYWPAPTAPVPNRVAVNTVKADLPAAPETQWITDDELLNQLASNGQRGGLAYVDGKPILLLVERGASTSQPAVSSPAGRL